jgi:tetratricopeptide (TPR) repeat protein
MTMRMPIVSPFRLTVAGGSGPLLLALAAALWPALWPALTAVAQSAAEQPPERAAATDKGETADAANAGQADLDAAMEAKLSADDLDDFATVLDLCKRAIKKGLSAEQERFAEDLYVDTLMYRASRIVQVIFDTDKPDAQWQRLRVFAMRDLHEVVERNPQLGEAQLMIAKLETLPGGSRERARAAAEKALELVADDRLQAAQAHTVLGNTIDQSDRDGRAGHYDKAVELAPRDKDSRRARGLFHLLGDDYEKARVDLEAAIEIDPDDASLHEALGLALMMDEKLDEAQEAFDRAIKLEPDAAGALLQRARLRAIRGDRPEAIADLDKAIRVAADDSIPLLLRARIHQQAGDAERAAADVARVLEKQPDNPAALELRGLMAAEQHDYAAAIRDFRRLVSQKQDDTVLVSQLAMLYMAAKQPREAIKRFSRALEIDENHFPSRRGRSDAEISIGDHKAALTDLEKALTLEADDSGVLNNLAWLLATSPDDAVRDGKRSIELATKACEVTKWQQPHIISTLAAAYAETGDFDSARKYSAQSVEADADTPAEVRKQLEGELASYRAGKPWRERQEQAEQPLEAEKVGDADDDRGGEGAPRRPRKAAPGATPRPSGRRPFDD